MRFKHISNTCNQWDGVFACHYDGTVWAVYEVFAWVDVDPGAVETNGTYGMVAGFVDTASSELGKALDYMGLEAGPCGHLYAHSDFGECIASPGTVHYALTVVDALWRYGAQDRVCDKSGNNLRKLVRDARAYLR